MPLRAGKKAVNYNVGEMIKAYKKSGKIGNTRPKSMKKARQIAAAAAYSKAKGK